MVPGETEAAAETWISRSAEESERAGEAFAPSLRPGDVVALTGPLGAGKTRVVAGIARGLGCKAAVRSPTFTLVNEYHGRLTLSHADLYRVDEDEVEALGLGDESGVLAVEWGEKLPARVLRDALCLDISIRSEHERAFAVRGRESSGGPRGDELRAAWRSAVQTLAPEVG